MVELIVGILATLAFPIVAVYVYHRREVWKNRRAGVRRTQKIKLAAREKERADKAADRR
jgi:type II secretory pathway pseudopilin PulG